MTTNWQRRSVQLQVGRSTTKIMTVPCKDSGRWERVLHAMFKHKRLPQSEWFKISEEEAISKMNWLANKTNQKMVVGAWQRAKAGNYYRRRKSRSGNWYTEQKSAYDMKQMYDLAVEAEIVSAEQLQLKEARKESGFWPTKENPEVVKWQEKDPTYQSWDWLGNIFIVMFLGAPVILAVLQLFIFAGHVMWPLLIGLVFFLLVLKIGGQI